MIIIIAKNAKSAKNNAYDCFVDLDNKNDWCGGENTLNNEVFWDARRTQIHKLKFMYVHLCICVFGILGMLQYAYSFIILVHFITLFQIPAAGFQRSLSQYLSHNGNNIIPKLNKNSHGTKYFAKPERLEDNVDGILYVNDHVSLQ